MKRQYIRSERAHFMCPNMHFGIAFQLVAEYDAQMFQLGIFRRQNDPSANFLSMPE